MFVHGTSHEDELKRKVCTDDDSLQLFLSAIEHEVTVCTPGMLSSSLRVVTFS